MCGDEIGVGNDVLHRMIGLAERQADELSAEEGIVSFLDIISIVNYTSPVGLINTVNAAPYSSGNESFEWNGYDSTSGWILY